MLDLDCFKECLDKTKILDVEDEIKKKTISKDSTIGHVLLIFIYF
jgi:hypothetical protein